jgi:Flp pilus assembly protein TadG
MGAQVGRTERRSLRNDDGGAAVLEFALIMPLLFGLLLATLEIGVLEMMSANFHDAVLSAARHVRTGQADGTASAQDFKRLVCAGMVGDAEDCRQRLRINVARHSGFAAAGAKQDRFPGPQDLDDSFDRGAPGDIILVNATYRWPLLTPFTGEAFPRTDDGNVLMTARLIFRNEPYR